MKKLVEFKALTPEQVLELRKIDALVKRCAEYEENYSKIYYQEHRERIREQQREYARRNKVKKETAKCSQKVVQDEQNLIKANQETPAKKKINKAKKQIDAAIEQGNQIRTSLSKGDESARVPFLVDFDELYYVIDDFCNYLISTHSFDLSILNIIHQMVLLLTTDSELYRQQGFLTLKEWKTLCANYHQIRDKWFIYLADGFNKDLGAAFHRILNVSIDISRSSLVEFQENVKYHVSAINSAFKEVDEIIANCHFSQ